MCDVMRLSTTVVLHGLCFVIDLDLISLAVFTKFNIFMQVEAQFMLNNEVEVKVNSQ